MPAEHFPERRRDDGEVRDQMARLDERSKEIPLIRQRVHEMAQSLAVLTDAAERAEVQMQRADAAHGEMLAALREVGREFAAAMAAHDRRDDERFEAVGSRLGTIETRIGVHDAVSASDLRVAERTAAWRGQMAGAAVGAAFGAGATLLVHFLK